MRTVNKNLFKGVGNNMQIFGQPKEKRTVVIMAPYQLDEVMNPSFGGARLILEQIKYFQESCNVCYIPLGELGEMMSILLKVFRFFRMKRAKSRSLSKAFGIGNEAVRWILNLVIFVLIELLSKVDFKAKAFLEELLKRLNPLMIIYNYPSGFSIFDGIILPERTILAAYEHNVEWKFYRDKLRGCILYPLVWILKKLELNNLKKADLIFCVSKVDRDALIREGLSASRMIVWVPLSAISYSHNKVEALTKIPKKLREKLEGKLVAGFVGSDFAPNIIAVENIIKVSRNVPENIVFLVIGSVKRAFETRRDISQRVIFTDYVNELDTYLALCDVFLNPKTTSDTGIEIKMFDYLKHRKPVISTPQGARGFEENQLVMVIDITRFSEVLRSMAIKRRKD